MIPMIGTIKSAVKLAEQDAKWQQKKDNVGKTFHQEEMTPEMRQIEAFKEDIEKMHESDNYAAIYNKLRSGKKLSAEEAEYLQKKNPQAYADYKNAQAEKEAFKKKLKNCKTKEEVRKLKTLQMGNFLSQAKTISNNPNIPKSKKLELLGKIMGRVMGLEEVYQEYVKSPEYSNLEENELIETDEATEKKPKKRKKDEISPENETIWDTFLGEEFSQIEVMYQGVMQGIYTSPTPDSSPKTTENVTNDATQELKCNS